MELVAVGIMGAAVCEAAVCEAVDCEAAVCEAVVCEAVVCEAAFCGAGAAVGVVAKDAEAFVCRKTLLNTPFNFSLLPMVNKL